MSDAIFPTLPGIAWDITKAPEFYTITKTSPTGLDVSAVLSAYPRWHFSLVYEYLRDDGTTAGELQQLVGFFLQRYGNVDDFLYLDPTDNAVANQVIAIGDGATKQFQLCRNFGGFVEPIYGVVEGTPTISVNGVPAANLSINSKALVTFDAAPDVNAVISWSGKFYYRVKFNDPMTEFNNFLYKLWEAKKIEFTSVKRVITT